jgi:hypothetical protein
MHLRTRIRASVLDSALGLPLLAGCIGGSADDSASGPGVGLNTGPAGTTTGPASPTANGMAKQPSESNAGAAAISSEGIR